MLKWSARVLQEKTKERLQFHLLKNVGINQDVNFTISVLRERLVYR